MGRGGQAHQVPDWPEMGWLPRRSSRIPSSSLPLHERLFMLQPGQMLLMGTEVTSLNTLGILYSTLHHPRRQMEREVWSPGADLCGLLGTGFIPELELEAAGGPPTLTGPGRFLFPFLPACLRHPDCQPQQTPTEHQSRGLGTIRRCCSSSWERGSHPQVHTLYGSSNFGKLAYSF